MIAATTVLQHQNVSEMVGVYRKKVDGIMLKFYLLIGITMAILSFAGLYILNILDRKKIALWQKIFALALFVFFVARYFGADFKDVSFRGSVLHVKDCIMGTMALVINSPFGEENAVLTAFAMLLSWANFSALTVLITYPFFKGKIKVLDGIVKYYAGAVYLVSLIGIGVLIQAADGAATLEALKTRGVLYAIETGFALGQCIYYNVVNWKVRFNWKMLLVGIGAVAGMFLISLPPHALQVLHGYGSSMAEIKGLTEEHRMFIYLGFLIPTFIFLLFYKQRYDVKRYVLLFISLATLHSYCFDITFKTLADITNWPLHLCNTAMFIIPLCLIFKWEKVFYFTFFINVLGAFFAILMPNYDTINWLSYTTIRFWINHYCAFFMPILVIAFKIYRRPKLKQFTYSLIAFAVYFIVILGIDAAHVNDVNYLFLNTDFVAAKLGNWAKNIRLNHVWEFQLFKTSFKLFPLYQFLYFLVYVLLSFAMWFIYIHFFRMADVYAEIGARQRKIKADRLALEVALNGRSAEEPMDLEAQDKLVLKNFSKKYSTSSVYAVKDASLTVNGGTIFGFLGPNGAGKSTIIKSIVGIQTITSGSIEICGYDVEKQPVMAKLQTGFVPDHYALYENLTGREYVNYIADLYDVSVEDRTARINEYVHIFNLEASFDNQIKTYSHGMKQKITIMSALVHNPKLWILDEPLTGLDPESIFQVKECMKKHAAAGNIVFFSSHLIDVVESLCDRIAIIKGGKILVESDLKDIEKTGVGLENFYLGTIGEL